MSLFFMLFYHFWRSNAPVFNICLSFHLVFHVIGQRGEEVDSRDSLHLIDSVHIISLGAIARLVFIYKSNGFGLALHRQHHLEKGFGHWYLVPSNLLVRSTAIEYRTADDVYLAFLFSPFAALLLHLIPVAGIQSVQLRTDVSEEKRLLLCLLTPFVVAR